MSVHVHALYFIPECMVKIKIIILCYGIHKKSWLYQGNYQLQKCLFYSMITPKRTKTQVLSSKNNNNKNNSRPLTSHLI